MACEGCAEDRCKRRDVTFVPHHAMLCSTRKSYAKILDKVHGVKNEEVIPDSYDPEKDQDAAVYRQRRVVRRTKKGCAGRRSRTNKNKTNERRGLGDVIESALSSIGVTESRVESWLGRPCNCKERREKLNKLSKWASQVLTSTTKDAESHGDSFYRIVGKARQE